VVIVRVVVWEIVAVENLKEIYDTLKIDLNLIMMGVLGLL
jgi:hypothetical protein